MKLTFFGKSHYALNLYKILNKSHMTINGVFDISLQSAVEFASQIDSKAYLDISEAILSSDVIFLTEDDKLKSYLKLISESKAENKILCLITAGTTSDKIHTNDLNTHFSIYSPHLISNNTTDADSPSFVLEGFGIRYAEFLEFMTSKSILFTELSIDQAKTFYSALNMYTNGLETLINILRDTLSDLSVNEKDLISLLTSQIITEDKQLGAFYTNDTHTIIKTLDNVKAQNKPSLTSLYKIIGLNALEYTTHNKDEKDHIAKILIEN